MKHITPEDQHRVIYRLESCSYCIESNIRIPLTVFRFGLSLLIGLIPGIGDLTGLILSHYVLFEARKIGANAKDQRRNIRNMFIELIGRLIPVFCDVFDAYKANTKNTELLKNYPKGAT